MSEQLFFQLLSKQMAGEAGKSELLQLKEFMDNNPEWKKLYQDLNYKTEAQSTEDMIKAEQAFALHSVKMQLIEDQVFAAEGYDEDMIIPFWKRNLKLLAGIAAAILIVSTTAVLLFAPTTIYFTALNKIETQKGSKTHVTLPDGTQVWVNADSKLSYNFKGKLREVWLTGEAFFDVKHNEQHSFIIHTDKITIEDLGTAFNVKSYPEDAYIETSLIRGKIQINFNDRPNETVILHPNEKLTVRKDQSSLDQNIIEPNPSKIKVDNLAQLNDQHLTVETAWVSNKMAFTNSPLADIAELMKRRFDIQVEFKNAEVMEYRYTGIFEDEDLKEILNIIKQSKPFNYELNGKKLIITK
jgi:transmembrane sensor